MTIGHRPLKVALTLVGALLAAGAGALIDVHHGPPSIGDALPPATSPPTTPVAHHQDDPHRAGPSYVAAAAWLRTDEGYRLVVRPSGYGRAHAAAKPGRALRQAIVAARPTPVRLTPSIRAALTDQLHCHAAFAPHKARWDLESWRPDVGYARTVLAACNP